MPSCSAARMISVPLGTATSMPSMVSGDEVVAAAAPASPAAVGVVTVIRRSRSVLGRSSVARPGRTGSRRASMYCEVLVAEVLERRGDGLVAPSPRAQNDRPRMLSQVSSSVSRSSSRALAGLEPLQDLHQPVGALAARACTCRRTRARRTRSTEYAATTQVGLVEDLQRAWCRASSPAAADALEVQRDVEVLGGEQRRRRAARRPELQLVAGAHAAGQLEQLAQRDAQRRLVLARAGRRGRRARRA